jgi:hypothetical protein
MNYFLIQAILLANIGDEESSFWIQILVFLFVAVSLGVYSLTKNNRSKHKDQEQDIAYTKSRWRFQLPHKHIATQKGIVQEYIAKMKDTRHRSPKLSQEPKFDLDGLSTASQKNPKDMLATEKNKDLQSGMELLELDFLLSVVENTKGNSQNDVIIRKLNFNEVLRREKLSQVKSKVLTVYAINRGNLYGKDIQCRAMEELAERTMRMNRHEALQPAVSPRKRERIVVLK